MASAPEMVPAAAGVYKQAFLQPTLTQHSVLSPTSVTVAGAWCAHCVAVMKVVN